MFDPNGNRRGGIGSTRQVELIAIAEFISINKIAVEVPGRKYDGRAIWESLAKISTKLDDDDDKKRNKKYSQYCQSALDIAVNGAVDSIFEASRADKQKKASDKEDEDNADGNVLEEEEIEVDASDLMNDGTNLDIDEEREGNDQTRNEEVAVVIGKDKRTLNITKTPVNRLALLDLETCAENAAEKKNWKRMRARMREGRDIELEYRKHVYETVLRRQNNNTDEIDAVAEGFSRLLE